METTDNSPRPLRISEGYQDQLDHWTEIVRAVLTAEGNIHDTNLPILKDETMSKEQRVALYCQNVAEEVLRATYAERS